MTNSDVTQLSAMISRHGLRNVLEAISMHCAEVGNLELAYYRNEDQAAMWAARGQVIERVAYSAPFAPEREKAQ